MQLKTNLHFHCKEDPTDVIDYTLREGIDYAASKNFEVLAVTCHTKVVYDRAHADYAASKNILLIPGIELDVALKRGGKGKHIVLLNADREAEKIKTFDDLARYKEGRPEIFVLAPHPYFFLGSCLKGYLEKYVRLFDAIEHSWFYSKKFDFNKKAEVAARRHNLPFIATSDTHFLDYFDQNFAVVDAKEKTIPAVFRAIREQQFYNITAPRNFFEMFAKQLLFTLRNEIIRFFR